MGDADGQPKDADWAAAITGLPQQQIVDFARLYGRTPRSFQDRLYIGHGEIPFPAFLRAIHASGASGGRTARAALLGRAAAGL